MHIAQRYLYWLMLMACGSALWAQGIDLGPNRSACDSLLLDATLPGGTYLWSTGDTTATVWISQSDTVSLVVDSAGTLYRDTVVITIVATPPAPQVSDTTVCGTGQVELMAGSQADRVLWFADDSSTVPIGEGTSFAVAITGDTTLYTQALNTGPDTLRVGEPIWGSQGGFFNSVPRGMRFDVLTPLTLEYVSVYADAPTTVTVELRQGGTTLQSATQVVAGGAVKQPIACFFDIPPGNNYQLVASQISGGRLAIRSGASFPYTLPGLITLAASSNNINNNYYYLFDWQVRVGGCASPRVPLQVAVSPSPQVDLGVDVTACGNTYPLDATFANPQTSYLWSTGDTTPTIVVSQSDTVAVTLAIGTCVARDTVAIALIDIPAPPLLTDTTICGPGELVLKPDSFQADELRWYANDTTPIPLVVGDSALVSVVDTTVIFVEARNLAQDSLVVGELQTGASGGFFNSTPRGVAFDVLTPVILERVSVMADQAGTTVEISLFDASGNKLDSAAATIPQPNLLTAVPVFFEIPPGTDYELEVTSITGGRLFIATSIGAFPYVLPGQLTLTRSSNNINSNYYYLFRWELQPNFCASNRVPLQVNVAPAPDLSFPHQQFVCGDSVVLDATQPFSGTQYVWQDSSQGSTLTLLASDTATVQVTIGQCISADTTVVELRAVPDPPVVMDTTVCAPGAYVLEAAIQADRLAWYDSLIGGQVLALGDSLSFDILDTTQYYLEAQNVSVVPNTVGIQNPAPSDLGYFSSPRGVRFDVLQATTLDYITVYAEQATQATIELRDAGGQLLESRSISAVGGGLPSRVALFMALPVGMDYTLIATNIQGELGIQTSGVQFPYELPDKLRMTGSSNNVNGNYYYLFNWELRTDLCASPRVPFAVTVELPLQLPSDIYDCDSLILSAGIPADTYLWNTGQTTDSLLVDTSGLYALEVRNASGCVARDTTVVEIPVDAGLPADGILCGNLLTTNYDTTAVHSWNTGDTTTSLFITQPGTYSVSVLEPRGCFLTDTITITGFDDFPTLELGGDRAGCDSVVLVADSATRYQWSTGDTTQRITVRSSGVYAVSIENENGCASQDTASVFINPSPTATFFIPDTVVSPSLLVAFINQSSFGSYLWRFGDGQQSNQITPSHIYPDTGRYCVTLIVSDPINDCGSDTTEQCFTLLRTLTHLAPDPVAGPRVYPNPVTDWLHVVFPPHRGGAPSWQIYDLQGRQVKAPVEVQSTGRYLVSLAALPLGWYVFHWQQDGRQGRQVIRKQ